VGSPQGFERVALVPDGRERLSIGGAGAVLSRFVKKVAIVAYEDLGTEAIRRLEVEDFPAIVVNDCHGGDLYEEGMTRYAR